MIRKHRRDDRPKQIVAALALVLLARVAGAAPASGQSVENLLQQLRQQGIDIIYSSELVPADWLVPEEASGSASLGLLRRTLGVRGLVLRRLAGDRYAIVAGEPPAPGDEPPAPAPQTLDEISVYASRYAIGSGSSQPRRLLRADIDMIPGSHDDAVRAVHALPGVVSNASGRPYIRGSLSGDVLIRYDGITLLDPYHLKNFQSLVSAIDPAAVEDIEVFSGGFPVRYGTRSGGVIDISAPDAQEGYEVTGNLSLLAGGLSTRGSSSRYPVQWLATVRRSTLDLLEPVENSFGTPRFSDSVGRVKWTTDRGAWTLGWLVLDDRLKLNGDRSAEVAVARYRDRYGWIAQDHRFSDALSVRNSFVVTSADRDRQGTLDQPGVASGQLQEMRDFEAIDVSSDWLWNAGGASSYSFGAALGSAHSAYEYSRQSRFSPAVAAAFGRAIDENVQYEAKPEAVTLGLYAAQRRRWTRFEMEAGIRLDVQQYAHDIRRAQWSPRLNLRYDLRPDLHLYASAGRFTQAQQVQEWHGEEMQQGADPVQKAMHNVLGLEYDLANGGELGLEVYRKRWTRVAPYFDNFLDPLSLLPELAPDRVRLSPDHSEASGLEVRGSVPVAGRFAVRGALTWAMVSDDLGLDHDVRRSWDQPVSITLGGSWSRARSSISLMGGWHSGWPRTRFTSDPLEIGVRNGARWTDFYSLDLRASSSWALARGDLSLVLDVTNATNRANPCCTVVQLQPRTEHWLPFIVNFGITYRWRSMP